MNYETKYFLQDLPSGIARIYTHFLKRFQKYVFTYGIIAFCILVIIYWIFISTSFRFELHTFEDSSFLNFKKRWIGI